MLNLNEENRSFEAIRAEIEKNKASIIVNNASYRSVNGILYSSDLSTLLYVPPMNIFIESFVVPAFVKKINFHSFCQCSLIEIICQNTIQTIVPGAFMDSDVVVLNLWDTNVEYSCWKMPKLKKVIFSKNAQKINAGMLYCCPKLSEIVVSNETIIQPELEKKYNITRREK